MILISGFSFNLIFKVMQLKESKYPDGERTINWIINFPFLMESIFSSDWQSHLNYGANNYKLGS